MNQKICLITTASNICNNPRLFKEADALVETGYEVTIISIKNRAEDDKPDLISSGKWKNIRINFCKNNMKGYLSWMISGSRHKFLRGLPLSVSCYFPEKAFVTETPKLIKKAKKIKADLYIAHNLGALPAAAKAAKINRAKLGFDAEDFHSAESTDKKQNRLAELIEKKYLPECDYITAASEPIAEAYAKKYNVRKPDVILNVFPLSFISNSKKNKQKEDLSLYWFSQTIGSGRGLEDAILAMAKSDKDIRIYLQGNISDSYRIHLLDLAKKNRLSEENITFLKPTSPAGLVHVGSNYGVGLALEMKHPLNRNLCLTNKILTYLLSGLSVIATDTLGQKPIIKSIGDAGWLYRPGDIKSLAKRLDFLANNKKALEKSKKESLRMGKEKYNWDIEKNKFLNVVNSVLS